METSLSPISRKRYNSDGDSVGEGAEEAEGEACEENGEEEMDSQSQSVINPKKFSANQRLKDAKTVERLTKDSPRLGQGSTAGKTADKTKIKGQAKNKPATDASTSDGRSGASCSGQGGPAPVSALDRYQASAGGKKLSAQAEQNIQLAKQKCVKAVRGLTLKGQQPPIIQRINTSKESDGGDFDVSLDVSNIPWHKQAGPGHRRLKEELKKKAKEEERAGSEAGKEKVEAMKSMAQSFHKFGEDMSRAREQAADPVQLWADSLVPQVARMEEHTRDMFMVHVLGIAIKAIHRRWDPADA